MRGILERRIDDWIFLCFFVGNDFLPHLPSLRIREGAIPRLIKLYLGLPGSDRGGGYLHKDGHIDIGQLELLMRAVGRAEDKIFVERHEEHVAKKGDQKKRRLQDFKGKLTAQQQYTLAHGPEIEEASFWMTAMSRTDLDDKERQKVAAEVNAPGSILIGEERELSSSAQEWLDRKRKREDTKASAKHGDKGSSGPAVLPPPLSAFAEAMEVEGGPAEEGDGEPKETEEDKDKIKLWQAGWKERCEPVPS
jgi:5'-3' exonuclease